MPQTKRRLKYRCPACNGLLATQAKMAGRRVACPHCGRKHAVPDNEPATINLREDVDGRRRRRPAARDAEEDFAEVTCRHCSATVRVRVSHLQRKVPCASCGRRFVASLPAAQAEKSETVGRDGGGRTSDWQTSETATSDTVSSETAGSGAAVVDADGSGAAEAAGADSGKAPSRAPATPGRRERVEEAASAPPSPPPATPPEHRERDKPARLPRRDSVPEPGTKPDGAQVKPAVQPKPARRDSAQSGSGEDSGEPRIPAFRESRASHPSKPTAEVELPETESPAVASTQAKAPVGGPAQAEAPQAETPEIEAPEAEKPETEASEAEDRDGRADSKPPMSALLLDGSEPAQQLADGCKRFLSKSDAAAQSNRDVPAPGSAEFTERLSASLTAREEALAAATSDGSPSITGHWGTLLDIELGRWRLERRQVAEPGQRTAMDRGAALRNRLGQAHDRFLATPVGVRLLDVALPTGICLQNPFRFLGGPATIEAEEITRRASTARLNAALRVGYDVPQHDVDAVRAGIRGARKAGAVRLVHELFWLHLPQAVFSVLQEFEDLTDDRCPALLRELATNGPESLRPVVEHALAVVLLNIAISRELAFAAGKLTCGFGYWDSALAAWNGILNGSGFWEYFEHRAALNRVSADVSQLKSDIPLLLAGLLGRFAQAYGQAGESVAGHRLLGTINRSPLPADAQESASLAAVRGGYY